MADEGRPLVMFLPSRDGFLTQLQETGRARCTLTGTDDLAVAIPAVVEHAWSLAVKVRVFIIDTSTLEVVVREDS